MKKIAFLLSIVALAACNKKPKFDATGYFEATEVVVAAENNGSILSLNISEGDTVSALQTLGAIDSVQLYLAKEQLMSNYTSVKISSPDIAKQIAALEDQIAKQQTELHRTENLLKAGAATRKHLDDIQSGIKVLESQLAAQRSTLNKNSASINAQGSAIDIQIAQIEDKLSKCRVKSPIDGTVLVQYMQPGEYALMGKPLFKVANLNDIYLRAYVTSAQLSQLKLGQQVDVIAQFGGDHQRDYKGVITWISSQSEFTPKNIQTTDDRANMVYAIKIGVPNDGYIKIGTYGEVLF